MCDDKKNWILDAAHAFIFGRVKLNNQKNLSSAVE